jgi:7,8-dihydropterin-6-yl-methyl-4-(beta-D-ribofuranosyl)aminobenzene 5'-phosphate synthase
MIHNLNITAIVENTAGTFDAAGEWGLALWIEADEHRILLDTGQGRTLLQNARLLGIDVAATEALVISHGHSGSLILRKKTCSTDFACPEWIWSEAYSKVKH